MNLFMYIIQLTPNKSGSAYSHPLLFHNIILYDDTFHKKKFLLLYICYFQYASDVFSLLKEALSKFDCNYMHGDQ